MKVLSWNCRGMVSKLKEDSMKGLIRYENPDILLIQETKMEEVDFLQRSKQIWKKGGGSAVSSRGASGGLGILWNDSSVKKISEKKNTHWIFMQFRHQDSKEIVSLFNIYAPVNYGEKKTLLGVCPGGF